MQKCSNILLLIPLDSMIVCLARTTLESSGARRRSRWPNLALNFRSTGNPTLPMRQTSLSCGLAWYRRSCSKKVDCHEAYNHHRQVGRGSFRPSPRPEAQIL